MIIVAGHLMVSPDHIDDYLEGCREVITAARQTEGCIAFFLSEDPIEPGRINIFEQWDTVEAVERFRGAGIDEEQRTTILAAHVEQHEIGSTISLT